MIEYKTLENVPFEVMHCCFINAFSDYDVAMDHTLSEFEAMLKRKAFDASLSYGAFKNGELIGLLLNSKEKYFIYTLGLGVRVSYRRMGIAKALLLEAIKKHPNHSFILEVLQKNTKAISLYESLGYTISRHYDCFTLDAVKSADILVIKEYKGAENITDYKYDANFHPSWQHSTHSILASVEDYRILEFKNDKEWIAFIVYDFTIGNICQFYVKPQYRRQGFGCKLFATVMEDESINVLKILNIDNQDINTLSFFKAIKAKEIIKQYEMILNTKKELL